MFWSLIGILLAVFMLLYAPSAESAGCFKGGAVGGAAGHAAGHGVLGAGAGCAVGHHEAKKHEKQSQQGQPASNSQGQKR